MIRGTSLRADLAGGIAGGVVTIPSSIGYGIFALAALGDAFIAPAILAGLYSAVVVSLVVILLGQWTAIAFAPRSIITVLFAAIVVDTIGPAARSDPGNLDRTLALVLLIVLVAGVFQALFGLLRVGDVIRYIPSPVMAGFQNAVAILLLLAQAKPLVGAGQPLTLAVGLATALVIWYGPRVARASRHPSPGCSSALRCTTRWRCWGCADTSVRSSARSPPSCRHRDRSSRCRGSPTMPI